jgi:hypothetical protein
VTLLYLILFLWLGQLGWLVWHFAAEAGDLVHRLVSGRVGEAIRREDAFYCWLEEIREMLPAESTYIFVDCYEAGKDIQARYFLYPRKMVALNPLATPAVLFEEIKKERAEFLVLRECNLYSQWQFLFQPGNPFFRALPEAGAGMVFMVDHRRLTGGFYD